MQVTVRNDTRTFMKPAKEDPAWTLWAKPRRRAASDRAPSVRRGPDELGSPPASRLSSRPVLRPGVTRRWLRQGGSLFSACPAEARPLLSGGVTRTSRAPSLPPLRRWARDPVLVKDGAAAPGPGVCGIQPAGESGQGGLPSPPRLSRAGTPRLTQPTTAEIKHGASRSTPARRHGAPLRPATGAEVPVQARLRAAALPTRPQTVPQHTGDWAPHS